MSVKQDECQEWTQTIGLDCRVPSPEKYADLPQKMQFSYFFVRLAVGVCPAAEKLHINRHRAL